jgi:CRISPR/Cas system-associated exonuclease Cas4 (RecB family)
MINLIEQIDQYIQDKIPRGYRDPRGFYVTHLGSCPRKVYNFWNKVTESNPSDLMSHLNFWVGDGFESALKENAFSKMFLQGIHLLNYQCSVGASDPRINGFADYLLGIEKDDKSVEPFVVELKTKYGWGSKKMLKEKTPNEEHIFQVGYYLKDLHDKGVTNQGCIFYLLMQDYQPTKSLVQFNCVYQPEDETVKVYEVHSTAFASESMNLTVNLGEEINTLKQVEKDIEAGKKSRCKFQHKFPVTREMLGDQSDNAIKEAVTGNKLLGDWQCSFCSYKDHCAEEEGRALFYNDEELKLLMEEHEIRKAAAKTRRATKRRK